MLEVLSGSSHEFEIKQRSLKVHNLGYFKNAPYYWMRIRGHGSCEAYEKALNRVIPPFIQKSIPIIPTRRIKMRKITQASLKRRAQWLMNDFYSAVGSRSHEDFIIDMAKCLGNKDEEKKNRALSLLNVMNDLVGTKPIQHLGKRIREYNQSAFDVLVEHGLVHIRKEPETPWFSKLANVHTIDAYSDKIRAEITLYENELGRAYERYEETREPIFYVNGEAIDLVDLPLVQKILRKKPDYPLEAKFLREDNISKLEEQLKANINFLQILPGARLPEQPEIIEKWFSGEIQ
ncbi:MAG: hypothetical protein WC608_03390 [Parcubacteria group bacterium]